MAATLIRRLLIANRGEIVARIARTAHRLGIDTVGVYADPDADALHVDAVDTAVALGGSTPSESYLRVDAVIDAARDTGCDAVHPGYGFLAENATFARSVIEAGLIWVGPTPEQIALLGDKVAAKQAAVDAGVPTAPVYLPGSVPDDLVMPVLVKAAAGGGGRGMRVVRDRSDLAAALEAAGREAASAFGDGTVFVEPYVEKARHIEVQIVGDSHGNVVHLGERECSIQRRNQKIIEEAPSAGIDEAIRLALCEGAVALARAVGYRNAGTVEFLVGDDGSVTFLEVNTRLQVEHPVTEAVTGLDIVELQLRVAAGEPLPMTQEDIRIEGHAIEARLVAEDPSRDWMPSTGEISAWRLDGAVRIDNGVRVGSRVTADYDSLLAKVIAHAPARDAAARTLARSLRSAHLAGLDTNRATLVAILEETDFLAAATTTGYFDGHPAVLTGARIDPDSRLALLLAATVHAMQVRRGADRHWGFVRPGWRNLWTMGHRSVWSDPAGTAHQVEETWQSTTRGDVLIGPWPEPGEGGALGAEDRRRVTVRVLVAEPGRVAVEVDGVRHSVILSGSAASGLTTTSAAGSLTWTQRPAFVDHSAEEAGSGPVSPLPGTVIAVPVEVGDVVAAGDVLMVIEAMKMEHTITAAGPALVAAVRFVVGDRVDAGDLLVRLDAAAD